MIAASGCPVQRVGPPLAQSPSNPLTFVRDCPVEAKPPIRKAQRRRAARRFYDRLRSSTAPRTVVVVRRCHARMGARDTRQASRCDAADVPDSPPSSAADKYEKLHPLLFSLDVFLPFVNLHQEHSWWPDADASGECALLNRHLRIAALFSATTCGHRSCGLAVERDFSRFLD